VKRALPVLSFCLLIATFPARAQRAEKPPTSQEVVAKFVKAVGGEEAWHKLHSRVRKGTIEFTDMGLKGTVELDEEAPDKILLSAKVAVLGDFSRGYDGTTGWSENPQTGVVKMSGSELADTRREAEFYMPLRLTEVYPHMEVTGPQTVEGHDAWEVKATAPDGAMRTFDFDQKTGYLLRITGDETSPDGKQKDHIELFLEDYKPFDGIMLPTIHRQTSPMPLVIEFTEVRHNVPLADSIFSPPAGSSSQSTGQ